MQKFSELIYNLGISTKTNDKLALLQEYFQQAGDKDKVWAIALFTGRRPKRFIPSRLLRDWCAEFVNIPQWLFDESYHTVGDLSETIALLAGKKAKGFLADKPLHYFIESLVSTASLSEEEKKAFMLKTWQGLADAKGIYVFNKLLSATFRIGVSQQIIIQALSKVTGVYKAVVAHSLMGNWDPYTTSYDELVNPKQDTADASKPYPFFLAYAVEGEVESLGDPAQWQAEWKWDGIRGQMIKRNNEFFVWSRGEELMTDRFTEYALIKDLLPEGLVIDGEIIAAEGDKPLPFALLQKRIGRTKLTKKIMQEAPVAFFAYDILEHNGSDIRQQPLRSRRSLLKEVVEQVDHPLLQLSPIVHFNNWQQLAALRQQSREHFAEGFMLKELNSPYLSGRKRGGWWKWKIEPLTIDAVMIYAQKGSGRRSGLYTDYTFAVRDGDKLVPFAKAYSGLTDKEIARVDNFVKRNSLEKFGPVRTVKPELVFEIAFEGISKSSRHKSGVALRFPRISRWREDKPLSEINTLDDLNAMLKEYG